MDRPAAQPTQVMHAQVARCRYGGTPTPSSKGSAKCRWAATSHVPRNSKLRFARFPLSSGMAAVRFMALSGLPLT